MGMVFSLAFCPTLFLLFFGLTIPLGLRSGSELLVPGMFAIGTALPLLAYAGVLTAGQGVARSWVGRLSAGHTLVRRLAGAIFVLAGIHDTLTYWAL
jgi:hypothetical protein